MEKIELDGIDYCQRQSAAELEYTREYEKWIESLSNDERAQLAALGLDKPSAPGWSSGPALGLDAADLAVAEEVAAPAEDEEIHDWQTAADLRVSEAIAKLISELLSNDATLATECLALISGVCYTGASENSIARKYQVTRAAVSKRCIELCERVGVKNFRAMKSEEAREIYAARAVEVHRRAGRELTTEPPRGRRIETIGGLASRIAGIWRRVSKSRWLKDATAADLLLARRSLRPAFQVADELERMIRAKDDRAIIRELDRDLATPPPRNLLDPPLRRRGSVDPH